jgi:hypothetical protein
MIQLIIVSTLNRDDSHIGSTFTASTLIATHTYASSIITSSISANTYYLNQSVYGQTIKKDSIDVFTDVTLQASDIVGFVDNPPSTLQVYTIGSTIQNQWIAVGSLPTIAYSNDGITWLPSSNGDSILSIGATAAAWNGNLWVAVGSGAYRIASSTDGDIWVGRDNAIFLSGYGIAWGNNLWVAVGAGNSVAPNEYDIATSTDGTTWTPRGVNIFQGGVAVGIAYNGSRWVAVGSGTNTIAYSDDGINWFPSANGNVFLSGQGTKVAWNGSLWVAVGQGANPIAYSYNDVDGSGNIIWDGAAGASFSLGGSDIAWNGSLWVAVGAGTNTIVYSYDGINWAGLGATIFFSGRSIAWNGAIWIATGISSTLSNLIARSTDGIHWVVFNSTQSQVGIAFNYRRPYTLTISTMQTSTCIGTVPNASLPIVVPANSQLDIVSDSYYNRGYTNFSIALQTHAS